LALQRDVPDDRIKRAIASLPDVQSCNVEFNTDGSIAAIHIVSSTTRAPKQIVRDVESVMLAEFDIKVDHRKISIARVEDKEEHRVEKRERPRLAGMKLSMMPGKTIVEVMLERGGLTLAGEASGTTEGRGSLRLLAGATFRALEKFLGQDAGFELLDVMKLRSGDRNAMVVLADFVSAAGGRSLAGCVQFNDGDDEQKAVVLAALDASNRLVEILEQPEQTEYEVTPFLDE
jgi:hypothetical protein